MKLFFKQNIDYQKGTYKGNCVVACNSSKVVFQKETETDFFQIVTIHHAVSVQQGNSSLPTLNNKLNEKMVFKENKIIEQLAVKKKLNNTKAFSSVFSH